MSNSNGLVRLYGQGAAVFSTDKDEFRARNGVLEVPHSLVNAAKNAGFTSIAPDPEVIEDPAPVPAPAKRTPAELRALPVEERRAIYEQEVRDAGYGGDAIATIVAERFMVDELIADGVDEKEAAELVWGGKRQQEPSADPSSGSPSTSGTLKTDASPNEGAESLQGSESLQESPEPETEQKPPRRRR